MRYLILFLLVTVSSSSWAEWQSTPDNSRLYFTVRYEGEESIGSFPTFTVKLEPEQYLEVIVDITQADMDSPLLNEAMAGEEWFNSEIHPQARFYSEQLDKNNDGYQASGTLTLKGIEQLITVPIRWTESESTVRIRGKLDIDRTLFNIGLGEWADDNLIGLDVGVDFDVQLQQVTEESDSQ